MNMMEMDWNDFSLSELEEAKELLEHEISERKNRIKDSAIEDFIQCFRELKKLNIQVWIMPDNDCYDSMRLNEESFEFN